MASDLSDFYFDKNAAAIAVAFFEKVLVHTKGKWGGRPFILEPWQRDQIIKPLFGWKRVADGTRKFRRAYIEIPRKNGKSTLGAGIANLLLFLDEEPGAEIYGAASDREQAGIVFKEAKTMVEKAPLLAQRAEVFKQSIVVDGTSSYRVLSADANTNHGWNAHGIIFDELHVQPNRDLYDVLNSSTGARQQPLIVMLTTAGYDRQSICWEQHEYARRVLEGTLEDPEFFAFIAAADKDDDWLNPEIWKKANPNLGVSIFMDSLESEARQAQASPAYQNTFRRLHLNQWTSQETRWIDLNIWNECGSPIDEKLLENMTCYGGLDLASSSDLAAFVLDFPSESGEEERHAWLAWFWLPGANLVERMRKDQVSYDVWVREGLIKLTEGDAIDYGVIVRDIEALGLRFNIKEIAFDRWGAFQVSQQLEGMGFKMIGFGQGFQSMSAPTKELLRLILARKLRHGANKALTWMADNVVVSTDPAGNVKPNKQKSRQKIDGIVAGVMALDRSMRHEGTSVYETRGLREV